MATRSIIYKILAVVVGIAGLYAGISERTHMSHVKKVGEIAVVDPIDRYTERKGTYSASFTFTTKTGQKIARTQSFPKLLIKDFESGVPVKVVYDPRSPSDFVFEKDSPDTWVWVVGSIGFVVAALIFL
jgi:hypothetical protein